MKLLVFAGSTRPGSYNRKLARETAAIARERGAEVTHLELADYDLPIYNADLEAKAAPPDVMKLKAVFHAHPAWIICTPEYNASYPVLVKNTLDWLSSPVKNDPPQTYALSRAGAAFDENGRLHEESARQRVATVVDQVLWAASRLRQD